MEISGSCVCGKIHYRLYREFTDLSYCHCSICRKLTGSAFASYGGVEKTAFKWTRGQDILGKFSQTKNTDRWFCSGCGSFLVTEYKPDPDTAYVSLGSLDTPPEIQMEYHQFFGSKVSWCDIDDTLEKYTEWPEDK